MNYLTYAQVKQKLKLNKTLVAIVAGSLKETSLRRKTINEEDVNCGVERILEHLVIRQVVIPNEPDWSVGFCNHHVLVAAFEQAREAFENSLIVIGASKV